ncbi:MAG: hypothetical protein GC155_00175 [Alphaproteobacteria bacterium]|nr:hypothetical protein [Alphaproteobacteria bacterium]
MAWEIGNWRRWMGGALTATAAALLATACSAGDTPAKQAAAAEPVAAPPRSDAVVRSEFETFEATGTDMADLLSAIRDTEPAIYDKLVQIAASPSWTGSPADAMVIGRPLYLAAFSRKAPFASDAEVGELIDTLIASHKALIGPAPLLCAKGDKADIGQLAKYVPADLLARENRLQARVLRVSSDTAPRATQAEIEEWKARKFKGNEARLQGNQYFDIDDPTPEQATKICDAEMFILEQIAREPARQRAYFYRGLLLPR